MRFYNQAIRVFKATILLTWRRSFSASWRLAAFRGGMNRKLVNDFDYKNSKLVFLPDGRTFSEGDLQCFNDDLQLLQDCIHHFNATSAPGGLIFTYALPGNETVSIRIISFDTCSAFGEIFIETPYYFSSGHSAVVLDVGMNVGIASLFFAAMPQVEKVYGYEIVKTSFDEACANIDRNLLLKPKIELHHAGVASADGSIIIGPADAGSMGSNIYESMPGKDQMQNSEVKLLDIAGIVKQVAAKHDKCRLTIKLDCEGAEYEIIERLHATSLLALVDTFIIEWHYKGWQPLVKLLSEGGFTCFASDLKLAFPVGYIHAVNIAKQSAA